MSQPEVLYYHSRASLTTNSSSEVFIFRASKTTESLTKEFSQVTERSIGEVTRILDPKELIIELEMYLDYFYNKGSGKILKEILRRSGFNVDNAKFLDKLPINPQKFAMYFIQQDVKAPLNTPIFIVCRDSDSEEAIGFFENKYYALRLYLG